MAYEQDGDEPVPEAGPHVRPVRETAWGGVLLHLPRVRTQLLLRPHPREVLAQARHESESDISIQNPKVD